MDVRFGQEGLSEASHIPMDSLSLLRREIIWHVQSESMSSAFRSETKLSSNAS